jgi:hypothetical protein
MSTGPEPWGAEVTLFACGCVVTSGPAGAPAGVDHRACETHLCGHVVHAGACGPALTTFPPVAGLVPGPEGGEP